MLDRRRSSLGLGAAVLAAAAGPSRLAAQEAAVGEVVRLRERAAAIRGLKIVPLAEGGPVLAADIVRTDGTGWVLIRCRDGLQIAIGGSSEVAVRTYLADEAAGGALRVALGLLRGIVRLVGGTSFRRQRIEVDTRTALASVRSTEWLVEAAEAGTGVLSLEGVVEVRGLAGGLVRLGPGQGTDVRPGAPPRPAARWGTARRLDAVARTTF